MTEEFSNNRWSNSIFHQLFLVVLAPLYLWTIIPPQQWFHGVIPGDSRLNLWALSWQWKTILSHPLKIWNGNAFFPFKNTITGSDHLFSQVLTGLPAYWLTENPFFSYHFVLFAGYALGALGVYRLCCYLYRQTPPALAASIFFVVALPRTVHAASHIQLAFLAWLPWSVYFVHRLFREDRWIFGAGFAVTSVLQILSGWYIAVYHVIIVSVVAVWLILKKRKREPTLIFIACSFFAAGCVMPFALPYIGRPGVDPSVWSLYAASLKDYIQPASYTVYTFASGKNGLWSETTVWMGFVAPILACSLLFFKGAKIRTGEAPVLVPYFVIMISGVLLSCGSNLPYISPGKSPWMLLSHLPGVGGMRVPARAVMIVIFALSILFGRAVWIICYRFFKGRNAPIIGLVLAVLVMIENAPLTKVQPSIVKIPEVYSWLKQRPQLTPVAEVPGFYGSDLWAFSADYMMYSTWHNQPIANGYSRYVPEGFDHISRAIQELPTESAIKILKQNGIDYVILHPQLFFHEAITTKMSRIAVDPDPVAVFNDVITLSNENYQSIFSEEGAEWERRFMESPHMTFIDRFGRDLLFYLRKPDPVAN